MTNVVDRLPDEVRPVFVEVIEQHDPALLAALRTTEEPTMEQREAVEDILGNEVVRNLTGPDWEPTERGKILERIIDEFLRRWPIIRTRQTP